MKTRTFLDYIVYLIASALVVFFAMSEFIITEQVSCTTVDLSDSTEEVEIYNAAGALLERESVKKLFPGYSISTNDGVIYLCVDNVDVYKVEENAEVYLLDNDKSMRVNVVTQDGSYDLICGKDSLVCEIIDGTYTNTLKVKSGTTATGVRG